MRGGHGNVGSLRHKKSAIIRYGIRLEKKRLLPKSATKQRSVASVGQIQEMLADPSYAHAISEHEGKKQLDLKALGYAKLLGSGKIAIPVVVKVGESSKSATAKIEAAGGRVERAAA
jgi:large subunit ribosomal protein L15